MYATPRLLSRAAATLSTTALSGLDAADLSCLLRVAKPSKPNARTEMNRSKAKNQREPRTGRDGIRVRFSRLREVSSAVKTPPRDHLLDCHGSRAVSSTQFRIKEIFLRILGA
jgi:hypothetical protein